MAAVETHHDLWNSVGKTLHAKVEGMAGSK
jgi:hypothetical protein